MFRRLFGAAPAAGVEGIGVVEAQRKLMAREAVLIDVRERDEWRAGHVKGARHIPLGELSARLGEIPRDREVLLFCRSGSRSGTATRLLRGQGFAQARNVEGGIIAWTGSGLPLERGNA
jgi:rhodanese-related sulfurtransferase